VPELGYQVSLKVPIMTSNKTRRRVLKELTGRSKVASGS